MYLKSKVSKPGLKVTPVLCGNSLGSAICSTGCFDSCLNGCFGCTGCSGTCWDTCQGRIGPTAL